MSVRKTLGLVKRAAEDAGVEWPNSNQSSAKKQRTGDPTDLSVGTELNLELSSSSERLKHVEGNMAIQDYVRFDDAPS